MPEPKSCHLGRPKRAGPFIKTRHLIALLATLCPVVCYISRQNISMAIVAMVNDTAGQPQPQPQPPKQSNEATATSGHRADSSEAAARPLDQQDSQPGVHQGHFEWTPSECNLVLGAFFWTYVIFQIPAARFAEQLGAKWILATATIGSAALSLISPWSASISVHGLFLVRALMGVCQTALYPACYVLYSRWLPPMERSQALPILGVGAYLGSIVASTSTGYFIQAPAYGWQFAFYMPGVLCAIWSLVWLAYGASEPRQHASISLEELHYIESKMEQPKQFEAPAGQQLKSSQGDTASSKAAKRKQISWLKLAKSGQIWALCAAFFASNWSFSILMLILPTYLNDILHIEPLDNGMINSTIYIIYCVASPIVGSISTMMVETRPLGISRLNVRKLFQGLALFGQSICFALLPLFGCQTKLVVATLFIQIILFSCVNGGEVQLPTELSVDFAGTIYAIGNCVGSSTGFIVPAAKSLIISNERGPSQWNLFFYVAALISSLGGVLFILFGRNDLFDYSKDNTNKAATYNCADSPHGPKLKVGSSVFFSSSLNVCKPSHRSKFNLDMSQRDFVSAQLALTNGRSGRNGLACKSWRQRPDIELGRQTEPG